ncbi:2,4-dienoyl-CoA reductase [Fimicolochytrium jonesii]|uniref:2,4-dienoyl-CoA reductase n=1 Tax=Fimicolochytrium jonesii TaxID=1396493 RepID=UPI0022FDE2D5|nr:2,4-dienoyl-CoA reductase [Fimicolochytrium jonesii]KAI8823111.1 2,4-dienoyl-CoA reductase [Fimicolochytrium jonesii]
MSVEPTLSVFQPNIFDGKVAFVTGGGSGICKGITEALMRHGAKAAIFSRSLDKIQDAAKSLSSATGKECIGFAGDVRSYTDLEAAMKKARDHYGKIDIVICGAAGNFLSPAENLSANGFKTVVEIDLLGTFNTAKAALPYLKESQGSLLSISATFHYMGSPLQVHCAAAKAGVDAMTKTLAVEWGHYGIRVNAIAPGPIAETVGLQKLTPKNIDYSDSLMPIQSVGKIRDIEHASLFMLGPGARFITGHILVVDGGHWLTGMGTGAPPAMWRNAGSAKL